MDTKTLYSFVILFSLTFDCWICYVNVHYTIDYTYQGYVSSMTILTLGVYASAVVSAAVKRGDCNKKVTEHAHTVC